ncbi:hypothetical protein ZIOFF_018475 [Zingiber officinale]|uniref:Acetyl-CoA carboxylase central domain-containing protein n=1 Tax=Zingiber officinale TaxID=94328 RepID=A0A8J5H888_ZINOF|nr:hypothetical protein ZIOFF_018475 [Zingiber officinale]
MRASGFDTIQICPLERPKKWGVSPLIKSFTFPIKGGFAMELNVAQFWSSGIRSHEVTLVDFEVKDLKGLSIDLLLPEVGTTQNRYCLQVGTCLSGSNHLYTPGTHVLITGLISSTSRSSWLFRDSGRHFSGPHGVAVAGNQCKASIWIQNAAVNPLHSHLERLVKPLMGLVKSYEGGRERHAFVIVRSLFEEYLSVEELFSDKIQADFIELGLQHKKDLLQVVDMVLSH